MYLYIENENFIKLKDIQLVIDYNLFLMNKNNKKILEKKKILDLSSEERGRRTIIFTKKYVYITSYTNRALKMRSDEYDNLVNSIIF